MQVPGIIERFFLLERGNGKSGVDVIMPGHREF